MLCSGYWFAVLILYFILVPGYYPPAGFNSNNQPQHPVHQHPPTVPPHPPPISAQYSGGGGKGIQNFEHNSTWQWKVGDKCMAKYWEDNMVSNITFKYSLSIL